MILMIEDLTSTGIRSRFSVRSTAWCRTVHVTLHFSFNVTFFMSCCDFIAFCELFRMSDTISE